LSEWCFRRRLRVSDRHAAASSRLEPGTGPGGRNEWAQKIYDPIRAEISHGMESNPFPLMKTNSRLVGLFRELRCARPRIHGATSLFFATSECWSLSRWPTVSGKSSPKRWRFVGAALVGIAMAVQPLRAEVDWAGFADSNWINSANWSIPPGAGGTKPPNITGSREPGDGFDIDQITNQPVISWLGATAGTLWVSNTTAGAQLTIQNGVTLSVYNTFLGYAAGRSGTMLVTGAGSNFLIGCARSAIGISRARDALFATP
jgi:hypothetical protein